MKKYLLKLTALLAIMAVAPYSLSEVDVIALDKDVESTKFKVIQGLAQRHKTDKNIALALGIDVLKNGNIDLNAFDSVIVLFVTKNDFSTFTSQHAYSNLSAIFIEPSPEQSINLARLIFGDTRRFVIPRYGSNEIPGDITSKNLDIKVIDTQKNNRWLSDIKARDVVIAIPDQNIYTRNSINSIARSLIRRRASLIGFSKSMTENVAAPASLHINDDAILKRLNEVLNNADTNTLKNSGYYVIDYDIAINKTLLKTLGIYDVDESELLSRFNKLKVEK